MNDRILLIETATDVCSVAVSEGNEILASGQIAEARSQASQLAPLIQDIVQRAGMRIGDLAAVAVSTAKGICFGAGIPLIGIGTLAVIARGTVRAGAIGEDPEGTIIIPMIDARRMEVYTALYSPNGDIMSETTATVLTPETFAREMNSYRRLVFTGNGAAKYESMIPEQYRDRCIFHPSQPEARDMAPAAFAALQEKRFEDTAYFKPFYLKEFIAADPSRKIEAVLHGH